MRNTILVVLTPTLIAIIALAGLGLKLLSGNDPKPVKTTKIELPLSVQRLAGVPVPRNRPLDYDPEHVAGVLAWRLEFYREIHCETNIC